MFYSVGIYSFKNNSNIHNAYKTNDNYYFSNNEFFWPLPGYHTITSPFGPRKSPTSGASSVHSGIDISAPAGSNIYSVISGTVTSTGFQGANGYTITVQNGNISILYCHVSPNYIVSNNQLIYKGNCIGNVGPKYVPKTENNTYTDSTGQSTNGATTGPHLHLTIKKDGIAVNPLDFF